MPRSLKLAAESRTHAGDALGPADIQQDKLSAIGQMASSVAHELSNPLAAIVASVQTMLALKSQPKTAQALETAFGPRAWEDLELILSEALRAGEIVNGLLAFARQEKAEPRPTSVMEILERTHALSRHHLMTWDVRLELRIDDDIRSRSVGWVTGDANQLQQVVLNLIINARQAIRGSKSSGTIVVSAHSGSDENVIITVDDDGPGVPPALRREIFEPFYTTKPVDQGTGLGLAISARIIRTHGGDIRVEENEQHGARFVITLPAKARDAFAFNAEPTTHGSADRPSGGCGKPCSAVLLVDDDTAVRRSVSRFLQQAGYHVEAVSTGDAAVALLRSQHFDVIVSDLRMPGLSGEQLYHLVRCEFPSMAGRIVVTSGDMMREETRHFIEHSGCPALRKPYELTDLIKLLECLCTHGTADEPQQHPAVIERSQTARGA